MSELLKKYFPHISPSQLKALEDYSILLADWNSKINLISRKDVENIILHHILHSLSIAKFLDFKPSTKVMDLGSGGGLPGIPLAIMFPDVEFLLIDRIGKKIKAMEEMIKSLGLKNVSVRQGDSGEIKDGVHFVVNRGVMPQNELVKAVKKNILKDNFNALPNGIISLKGGDLSAELKQLKNISEIVPLENYFSEPFFETKKIVFTPMI